MKKIIHLFAVISLLFVSFSAFAQQITVSGNVKDSKGEPVIGAVVVVEGYASLGAISDVDGNYKLTFTPDAGKAVELTVSCISYRSQTVKLGKNNVINFVLEEDNELLDEVIVVGYGSMRRSDLTGSVTSVKIDDTEAGQSGSLDQLLQGHAAGVDVLNTSAAPDAGVAIRIRGVTSLNGSSEPLYVVDGVIMSDPASSTLLASELEEDTNSLMGINPNDIASIEILKDASATAIYGAAGANGVVLITTKQANREKPVIRFNVGVDYNTIYKKIDVLGFEDYMDMIYTRSDSNAKNVRRIVYEDPDLREGLKVKPMRWQDEYMHNTFRQRYFFSVSGRPKTMSYTFSLGYNSNPGLVDKTGVNQYTMRLNVDKTFLKKFKVGTKINLAYVDSWSIQGAGSDGSLVSSSFLKSFIVYRPFTTTEWDELDDLDDSAVDTESKSGPDRWFKDAYTSRKEFRVTPSFYAQYQIAPWLIFKSSFGADFRASERTKWKGGTVDRRLGPNGAVANMETYRWNWDNMLMVNEKLGKHSVSGTLGMTLGHRNINNATVRAENVIQYKLQADNLNSKATQSTYVYEEREDANVSFFARGVYNYDDRYVLTLTGRVDGSSQFRGSNRYSFFPSAAFAWRLNQEPWFNVPVISMAKLRIGWGQVGNSSLSAYQTFNGYGNTNMGSHINPSGIIVGIYPSNFSNEGLKWETTRQWNVGLDYGMWKGRFTLSVDAYDKTTYDLLQQRNMPYDSGFNVRWVNEGTINNRGLEFSTEITPIKGRNFEWSINGNLSLNRNKLVSLGFAADPQEIYREKGVREELRYYTGSAVSSTYLNHPVNVFIEGEPIGLFYGIKTEGILGEGEEGPGLDSDKPLGPGNYKYVDMNEDGVIDKLDRTIIGTCNADFTYGFGTSFVIKNFTINANFDGVYGRQILNANLGQELDISYQSCYNVRKEAWFDRWSPENPNGKYVALNAIDNPQRMLVLDRYLEDGSYLRLASLNVTYNVPLKKTNKILKGLSVGVAGNNLCMWTKYSGLTPMVNSFGTNVKKMGVDFGGYPATRSYCFDLKFTF